MPDSSGLVSTYAISTGLEGTPPGVYTYDAEGNFLIPVTGPLIGGANDWIIQNGGMYNPGIEGSGIALGPEGTNFLEVSPNGSFRVQAGRGADRINKGTSLYVEYGMAGTVDIMTGDGEAATVDIGFAKLARTGKRWAWQRTDTGGEVMVSVPANMTLNELNATSFIYNRWATPAEVEGQALAGRLLHLSESTDPTERDLWRSIMSAMGLDTENPPQNLSGEIMRWVEISVTNFSAASRYSFSSSGSPVR